MGWITYLQGRSWYLLILVNNQKLALIKWALRHLRHLFSLWNNFILGIYILLELPGLQAIFYSLDSYSSIIHSQNEVHLTTDSSAAPSLTASSD
jgi:hypothetical protein